MVTVVPFMARSVVETRITVAFSSTSNANAIKANKSGSPHVKMPTVHHKATHASNEAVTIIHGGTNDKGRRQVHGTNGSRWFTNLRLVI